MTMPTSLANDFADKTNRELIKEIYNMELPVDHSDFTPAVALKSLDIYRATLGLAIKEMEFTDPSPPLRALIRTAIMDAFAQTPLNLNDDAKMLIDVITDNVIDEVYTR